ncbi:hypothetical protein [Psychrobacter sp. H8-1]|uniref:hypothetical protein n=1 Tax=Psychrobacter sp. H8-1 TaxID=2774129 RepID=UPI001919BB23|nr:hypothetical protein [Psychrobacter sp. H8-1]
MSSLEVTKNNLAIENLEEIYDVLANAIDSAPKHKRELFLVKLALLNANALNDKEDFIAMIHQASVFED